MGQKEELSMVSVIAKLDKSSRARLSWIQSFAASFGIVPKPIYGHITLASVEEALIPACKDALAGQGAVSLDFEKVDVLPAERAVAALAAPEGPLADLREKLAGVAELEENWQPCTILIRDPLADPNWVRMAMDQMFQPFTAKIERIEFMSGNEIVDGMDLKGEDA